MGWMTWDVDGAGCSSTTGTLPRSLALRHLASLSLITAFQLAADQFSNEFLTSRTGSSYYLVVVGDAGKHAGGMGEGLGVFFCKKAKLSDWGVFFQNDFTFTVGENFKWGTFFDSQGPTDFFWDDHPAQIIYSSYDSCRLSFICSSCTL